MNTNSNPNPTATKNLPLPLPPPNPRPDDRLAQLSREDQQQLRDWLDTESLRDVVDLAAKPPPEGLDLHTNKSALQRFHQKHALRQRLAQSLQYIEQTAAPDDPPSFEKALETFVDAAAIDLSTRPKIDAAEFRLVSRHLQHIKQNRHREQTLELHRLRLAFHIQNFQWDAAKDVMDKLPQLNEIAEDKKLTPKERTHKIRVKIFGSDAVHMVDRAHYKFYKAHPEEIPVGKTLEDFKPQPYDTPEQAERSARIARNTYKFYSQNPDKIPAGATLDDYKPLPEDNPEPPNTP